MFAQTVMGVILLLSCPQLSLKDLSCLQNILLNYHNQTVPLWTSSLNALTPLASALSRGIHPSGLAKCCTSKYSTLFQFSVRLIHWEIPIIMLWANNYFHYFMGTAQDIWVLNHMHLTHFLSHLSSHVLLVLWDKSIGSLVLLYILWR